MADSANDHALDSTEAAIEKIRAKPPTEANRYRLLNLEMKRDRLQAKAFRALQKKIAGMKK